MKKKKISEIDKYLFDLNGYIVVKNALKKSEINACNRLIAEMKNKIGKSDKTVKGFNLGINSGVVAGQTIMHCHIHLIPRRKGDIENPRGGVRGVIPSKQKY